MEFCYERSDILTNGTGQGHSYLLSNGLGGYSSLTSVFSAPRKVRVIRPGNNLSSSDEKASDKLDPL